MLEKVARCNRERHVQTETGIRVRGTEGRKVKILQVGLSPPLLPEGVLVY